MSPGAAKGRYQKQVLGFLGLEQGRANLFFKGPDSKYFWHYGPEDLLATTLTVIVTKAATDST